MNTHFPIFLNLENKPCLVVGGGKVACQKVHQLLESKATLTVIAPKVSNRIEKLAQQNSITLKLQPYKSGDVKHYTLVIGATDDQTVNQKIYADAVVHNIPVNIVDQPSYCTFYMASVHHQGDLKIALSTNGRSPTVGQFIRDQISKKFGPEYAELLVRLGIYRGKILKTEPNLEKRQRILKTRALNELERLHKNGNIESTKNKVVLVGAGPGDPELISVKGLKVIQAADVIYYDSLINPQLLKYADENAELISVGKIGKHKCKQTDINQVLIKAAKSGKNVVRLKSGDPFIFGRGGEEIQLLAKENIPFEVIPGISSGIGAPANKNIPLTHRDLASTVLFVTGHECMKNNKKVDWKSIAELGGTIVIFMGVKSLSKITSNLIQNGLDKKTPAAIIQNGTFKNERIITGTILNLGIKAKKAAINPPALIIIGEVVSMHKNLTKQKKEALPYPKIHNYAFSE